ncbi:penicillin-binding protein 1B, partial [Pseudomonas sp. CrR25]|nr:penicillin-binding protein 1B [Pseudomonas sp. CrR25]
RKWPAYPSMLLGAGALTPMEVADMYQTLANGGFNTPLRGIRSVLTAEGEPLKRYPYQIQQRFDAGAIYLLQNAMQRTMREGTGRSVYSQLSGNLNLAGKTGTSNDSRDSWFAGFSQDLLAVVWLGRDDNGPTPLTGASGALQVWTDFMRKADPLPLDMPLPDNVVQAWVDASSGQGSDPSCPNAVQMPYIRGSEPAPGLACGIQAPVDSVMDWVRGWLD